MEQMFGFLVASQEQRQTSETLSCHGYTSGRHRHVPTADSARVDDRASGDAAPGWNFVSMIESAVGGVRYRYFAWSTYRHAV